MKMKRQIIEHSLREANDALADFLASPRTLPTMEAIVDTMAEALRNGCKIMSCGNGGSLCDATHFAEELTGRFRENRRPLAAMAINDPAYMTCVGNDFSFGDIFVRWVEAFGKPGDVLLAISTSGNSQNIVAAAEAASGHEGRGADRRGSHPAGRNGRRSASGAPHAPFGPHSGDTHQSYPHRDRGPRKGARFLILQDTHTLNSNLL